MRQGGPAALRYNWNHLNEKARHGGPAEAAPAGVNSEWIQCDLCQKWRIVKCSEIDALPENAPWICSMKCARALIFPRPRTQT